MKLTFRTFKIKNGAWLTYLVQLAGSLIVSIAFGSILVIAVGENPFNVYSALISQAFLSPLGLGIAIQRATPLILTSAAAVLAFKGGAINMGIEGQFLVGGAIAALVASALPEMPSVLAIAIIVVFCALGGAFAGWIPAFFRMVSGVNEVITGMIANLVVPPLMSFILGSIMRLPFMQMFRGGGGRGVPEWSRFAQFAELTDGGFGSGTRANTGIFLAVFVVIVLAYVFKRSKIGYEIRISSANFMMAEYSGINARRSFYLTLMLSGAIAAIGGATEVLGVWRGYSSGGLAQIGYNGLLVALAGGNNFLGALTAASIYGGLQSGAMNASWTTSIPRPLIDVLVEILIVFAAVPSMRLFFSGSGQDDSERLGSKFTHMDKL